MKLLKALAPLAPLAAAVALLGAPVASNATLLIHVNYASTDIIFADGGCDAIQTTVCDQSNAANVISYSNSALGFNIFLGSGTENGPPFDIHMNVSLTGPATSPVTIEVTNTNISDYVPGSVQINSFGAGTTSKNSGLTGQWSSYVDVNNAQFGKTQQLGSWALNTFADSTTTVNVPNPYSVTLSTVTDFTKANGANASVSYDIGATAVPEPTSIALVGLALVGLGFSARRRRV